MDGAIPNRAFALRLQSWLLVGWVVELGALVATGPRFVKCDTPKTVPFDDACREFVAFLASQGSPTSLRWFCREDVTAYRRRVRVLASTPDANCAFYERYYRYGVSRGMGLRLEATFFTEATSWCQVWCPEDESDASQAMMGGSLHYSVSSHPPQVTIHGSLPLALWRALDTLRGPSPFLAFVPRRSWLQTFTT